MILQGSIKRFQLGSVLQFLAQNTATGILTVRDVEEHGSIYLVRGRLEAISMPVSDDRLGVYLVKAGMLSETHLRRALMEADGRDGEDGHKPLGQRLVEKGFTTETIIRRSMCHLTLTRMFELAHWRSGMFTYDEPDEMPDFQIAIRGDVQELLLRTQLRIDHGDRPRKKPEAPERDELCLGCPVTDCSPDVRLKYLKTDICLWRQMSTVPDPEVRVTSQDDIDAENGSMDPRDLGVVQGTWAEF